ncbi:hypothetical protein [Streptomyces pratensis]|uniref:hypothetical protein n=1 Tax=Streptomyces pratensis TaxID=1169025 RepID=UPI00363E49A4
MDVDPKGTGETSSDFDADHIDPQKSGEFTLLVRAFTENGEPLNITRPTPMQFLATARRATNRVISSRFTRPRRRPVKPRYTRTKERQLLSDKGPGL